MLSTNSNGNVNRSGLSATTRVLAIAGIMAFTSTAAYSQVVTSGYFVRHAFRFFGGFRVMPRVTACHYAHAWQVDGCQPPSFAVVPAAQPAGWAPFGLDFSFGLPIWNTGGVRVNEMCVGVGPGGYNNFIPGVSAVAGALPFSRGVANSRITVNPFGGVFPVVSGVIQTDGTARAVVCNGAVGCAYAFSGAKVSVRRGIRFFGAIFWLPTMRTSVSGGALACAAPIRRRRDPIVAKVYDADGTLRHESTMLDIALDNDGDMNWEADPTGQRAFVHFNENNRLIDFQIRIGGEFVDPTSQGHLVLRVQNQMVVESHASGVFQDVQLPMPGMPFTGAGFELPAEYAVNYNIPGEVELPGDTNYDGQVDDEDLTNVILDFGTPGGISADTDVNRDGVVDDGDITIVILNYGQTGMGPELEIEMGGDGEG